MMLGDDATHLILGLEGHLKMIRVRLRLTLALTLTLKPKT